MRTMINPTGITATLIRPVPLPGDWNWAEQATALWLDLAENVGIIPTEQDYREHGEYVAARVRIDDTWYELQVRAIDGADEVRAVEITDTDDEVAW